MRRASFGLILHVIVMVCFLVDLPPALEAYDRATQEPYLTLNFTPLRDEAGQARELSVSYTLQAKHDRSGAPLELWFDTLEPALSRSTDQVSQLRARDALGAVAFARPSREVADGKTYQVWRSGRPLKGVLHVSYVVPVAVPHPAKRGPHIDLQAAGGGLSGALVGVLLLPRLQGTVRSELVWHMPRGENAVSTFAYGNSSEKTSLAELGDTLFLAGPLQVYPSVPPTTGFSMYALGVAPGALAQSASWYRRTYRAMQAALRPRESAAFRVLIRSYDGGPLDSGRANNGSLLLYLPPSIDPGSTAEHSLIAHEMVHVFTKPLDGDPNGQGDWFTEGIADYLKITIPFAAGLYTRAEYLELVNAEAALYYTNPDRELPLKKAAEEKWSGNVTWTIPYARGAMYFANLDADLSLASRGQSVLALIQQMNRRILSGQPANDATWLRLLREESGDKAVEDWQEMRDGRLLIPRRGTFGERIQSNAVPTGFFSLGYAPAYHTAGAVIQQVEKGSNAETAGLLPGDQLIESVDISPLTHSFHSSIRLQIDRHGTAVAISFDPHTRKQVPAWYWTDNSSDDKTRP
jgi:hypothetical protein